MFARRRRRQARARAARDVCLRVGGVGGKVTLAVRDTGSFLDPRSGKDWWQ